jgi:hypothetical protein
VKAKLSFTRLEDRETPSHVGGPGPGDNMKNDGQHGAVVSPPVQQPPAHGANNGAQVIFMPDTAHQGNGSPNGHGPVRVYDDIPNENQG